jgi:hypothetical protein
VAGSAPTDDSEAINSDLDDSDTEGEEDAEEGGVGETDIVFCTYDKVISPLFFLYLHRINSSFRSRVSKTNGSAF